MTLTNLFSKLKGGAGSGNKGHAGRPGKRGGSSSSFSLSSFEEVPRDSVWGRAYFIRISDGGIEPANLLEEHHELIQRVPHIFKLEQKDVEILTPDELLKKVSENYIQVRVLPGETNISGLPVTRKNLRLLQDLSLSNKLPHEGVYQWADWNMNSVSEYYSNFINAKYLVKDKFGYTSLKECLD